MIEVAEFKEFRYSEPQWSELKAVVRDVASMSIRSRFG